MIKLFQKLIKESEKFKNAQKVQELDEWYIGQIMLDAGVNYLCCMIETYATDQGKEKITGQIVNHLFNKYISKEEATISSVN